LIAARDLARLLQAFVLMVAIAWMAVICCSSIGDRLRADAAPARRSRDRRSSAAPHAPRRYRPPRIILGPCCPGHGRLVAPRRPAASPPRFGVLDSTKLGYDAGYYVSVLPWLAAIQNRALILVVAALGIVALLYGVIGSCAFAGPHPRQRLRPHHLGVLGACLALVIAWGAALDPAEIVGGLHGKVDQAALTVRIPGRALSRRWRS